MNLGNGISYSKKNGLLTVHTPRGNVYQSKTKSGKVRVEMGWRDGFGPDWSHALQSAQARFDEEVIKVTEPYVPIKSSLLRRSAAMASKIGSGQIVYATPYAAAQYYKTADTRAYNEPKAGGHWGDRMKADNLNHLANFARGMVKKYGK